MSTLITCITDFSRITYEEYNVLSAKIITLFSKESIGTYFTKPIKKINSVHGWSTIARGKQLDKVRNLLYKYGDRKRKSDTDCENVPPGKQYVEQLKSKLIKKYCCFGFYISIPIVSIDQYNNILL